MKERKPGCGRKKQKLSILTSHCHTKAHLLAFPGKDIALEIDFFMECYPFDTEIHKEYFIEVAKEWFLDTKIFIPEHLIICVNGPSGYMVNRFGLKRFSISISVCSRTEINIDNSLKNLIDNELERLSEVFDEAIDAYASRARVAVITDCPNYHTPEINTSYLKENFN